MSLHVINVIHASTVVGAGVNQNTNQIIQPKKRTKTDLWTMTMDNKVFKLHEVVAIACAIIEHDGEFRGNANTGYAGDTPGFQSTKDRVLKFLRSQQGPSVTPDDIVKAEAVISYFAKVNRSDMNDFMQTLKEMASTLNDIPENRVGYAVAMVPTYDRMKRDEEFLANSDYVGVTGKRQNLFLKLIEKKYIRGAECYLYTFVDRKQNVLKTWVTYEKKEAFNFEVGDCIDMDAYIAKHEANRYTEVRETYINRIKVIENKGTA